MSQLLNYWLKQKTGIIHIERAGLMAFKSLPNSQYLLFLKGESMCWNYCTIKLTMPVGMQDLTKRLINENKLPRSLGFFQSWRASLNIKLLLFIIFLIPSNETLNALLYRRSGLKSHILHQIAYVSTSA